MSDPSLLGYVQDVDGGTVSVVLEDSSRSGLVFVAGLAYHVAQVGSFVRIPLGFSDLIGVVSRAGSGAVPERLAETNPFGRMWLTVQLMVKAPRADRSVGAYHCSPVSATPCT